MPSFSLSPSMFSSRVHPQNDPSILAQSLNTDTSSSTLVFDILSTPIQTTIALNAPRSRHSHPGDVIIFNCQIPIWAIAAAAAGIAMIIILIIILLYLRRKRRMQSPQTRPLSMESFSAGETEESFIDIANTREDRSKRLIREIALITDPNFSSSLSEFRSPSQEFDLESSSDMISTKESFHSKQFTRDLAIPSLYY